MVCGVDAMHRIRADQGLADGNLAFGGLAWMSWALGADNATAYKIDLSQMSTH